MPTHTNVCDVAPLPAEATTYLNAGQVRTRYGGVSDMALWRWLQDDDLGFPKPLRINRRRFWKASDLTAWERARRSPVDEAA